MTHGQRMYQRAEKLFPICRSLTGNGVRETLRIIGEELPELNMFEVPSGTQALFAGMCLTRIGSGPEARLTRSSAGNWEYAINWMHWYRWTRSPRISTAK